MASIQVVVFKLDNEFYGVDITKVREIGPYIESVKVPNTPEFVEGIINFRGDIIPIINLRKVFMLEDSKAVKGTRIIIVNAGNRQLGIIVDEASEVLYINNDNIESSAKIVTETKKRLISGIGKEQGRIIMLLDLSELVNENSDDMEAV
ncbi:MAG TPA: chemotaxis protein CheW [Clostridia bacterium]|nr:chemotaxis protein CheW [Clostridia bacterium]